MTSHDVLLLLARLVFGPWIRLWRGLTRRSRRYIKLTAATAVLLLATAGAAWADGGASSAMSWIAYKDSHGITLWQYELSFDGGGALSPFKAIWGVFVQLGWSFYCVYVGLAVWLMDMTLSFEWLTWLITPAQKISDSLQVVVDRFGATGTFLTIAAVTAVVWMARGKWVLGVFELFMSLVIASLTVGIFSNPVQLVAGPDGILMGSRDFGLSVASGLANNGDTSADPDQMREDAVSMIIDTFVRQPHQLINFGHRIDGTKCEDEYQKALENGPYGDDSDLRDAVGACDEAAGEAAENPSAGTFMSMLFLTPSGSIVILFNIIICLAVLFLVGTALYSAVRLVIDLVIALLPSGRGSLWLTAAELLIALVELVFSITFFAAWLLVIQEMFNQKGNPTKIFFIVDIFLLVGIVLFWKGRARLRAAKERLARAMAKKPRGGAPSQLPRKVQFNAADAYYKGRMAVTGAKVAGKGAAALSTGLAGAAGAAGKAAASPVGTAMSRIQFAASVGAQQSTDAPDRLTKRLDAAKPSVGGQLARAAVPLALAAATGGSSLVAQRAATQVAVSAARRTALQGKLRPAAIGPGPSSPGGVPGPEPRGPGRPSGPRFQPRPATAAPTVVRGDVVSNGANSDDAAARLKARLAEKRAIPMPGSRAIPMPGSRAIPMPAPKRPKGE